MLKISWSIEGESSTMTTTSVWGLKYVPGRTRSSSISTIWLSLSALICLILSTRSLTKILEVAKLALDLRLHVQGLFAAASTAVVAGDDEVSNLLADAGVEADARIGGLQQALQLSVHVQRRLPPRGL